MKPKHGQHILFLAFVIYRRLRNVYGHKDIHDTFKTETEVSTP